MTKTDAEAFAQTLLDKGYRKWTQAKYGEEDYDVSHLFKDDDDNDLYQIIYRFWDWTKYPQAHDDFSIDVAIIPCLHSYGRADVILSNCEFKHYLDIDWTEQFAKEYYEFITKRITNGKEV